MLLSRPITVHVTGGTATVSVDPVVAAVYRINSILTACGVSQQQASIQIYQRPEGIHIIAPTDLAFLVENAKLLVTHKDVVCDFSAFFAVLWGMLRSTEKALDDGVLHTVSGSSSGVGGLNMQQLLTVAPRPAASRGSFSSAPGHLYASLYPHLVQTVRVTTLLRAYEELAATGKARATVKFVQKNVDAMVHLTDKLNQLFELQVTGAAAPTLLSILAPRAYSKAAHAFFRITELSVTSSEVLLSTLAARSHVDVSGIVRMIGSEALWRTSAYGLASAEGYTRALHLLTTALLTRRHSAFDNGQEICGHLVWERLGKRPPYSWRTFRLLYFSPVREGAAKVQDDEDTDGIAGFGLLCLAEIVRGAIEKCLVASMASTPAAPTALGVSPSAQTAATRSLRSAVSRELQRVETEQQQQRADEGQAAKKRLFSFYELYILAALRGMPQADLTDNTRFVERATETHLCSEDCIASPIMTPSFLRLLLAYAYTMPTADATIHHALLTPTSTLALFDSIAEHILQLPRFAAHGKGTGSATAARVPPVSALYASESFGADALMKLVVLSAMEEPELEDEQQHHQGEHGEDAHTGNNTTATSTTTMPSSQLGNEHASTITVLLKEVAKVAGIIYTANDTDGAAAAAMGLRAQSLQQQGGEEGGADAQLSFLNAAMALVGGPVLPLQPQQPRQPVSFTTATARAAALLFYALDSAVIFQTLPLPELATALHTLTKIFALHATHAASSVTGGAGSLAAQRKRKATQRLTIRMQQQLATIPQHMAPSAVEAILVGTLAPLTVDATTLERSTRVGLARTEAYLRSLATASAAFAVSDACMLKHWTDIALPCLTTRKSAALAAAAHDFLIAPFLAHKAVSVLFAPTYVAVFVPSTPAEARYGEPPTTLLKHFAAYVRAACQGIEKCNGTTLMEQLADPNSAVAALAGEHTKALEKLDPISAVLLVVASLFDKLCLLWSSTPGYIRDARERFVIYFSAMVNLLQCSNSHILHRVCASVEAIEVEKLRGSGPTQLHFLEYIGRTVDNVRGSTKKEVAEWFMKVSELVMKENKRVAKL